MHPKSRPHVLLLAAVSSLAAVPAVADVVAHWKFDDGPPSSTAVDSLGNAPAGTLTNMSPASDWVTGQAGLALDFDGVNDFVNFGDNALFDFGAGDFSVSYWVTKRETSSGFANTWGVSKWNTGAAPGTNEWVLSLTSGGSNDRPGFTIQSGVTSYSINSPDNISLNDWHHIVGTREDDTMRLFVDGELKAEDNSIGAAAVNDVGRNLRVAYSDISGFSTITDGLFDDIQLYDHALSFGGVGVGDSATPFSEVGWLFANPGLTTNDLQFPLTPEPSTWLLLTSALLIGGGAYWRRRRVMAAD